MIRIARTIFAAAFAAAFATTPVYSAEEEWVDLLANGLDGFTEYGADGNWAVTDGVLTINASEGDAMSILLTPETYQDFELTIDFKVTEEHNSGIYFRCADVTNISPQNCYEANVNDHRDAMGHTGAFSNRVATSELIKAAGGHWNTYKLHVEGDHIMINLNGTQTVDTIYNPEPGGRFLKLNGAAPIGLQWLSPGTLEFKNWKIRRL